MLRATDTVSTAGIYRDGLTLCSRGIEQQCKCTAASGMATIVAGDVACRPRIPTTGRRRFGETKSATLRPRKT